MHLACTSLLLLTLSAPLAQPQRDGAGPPSAGESDLGYLGWLCPLMVLFAVAIGVATWYGQRKAKERVGSLEGSLVDEVAGRRARGRPEEAILPPAQVAERVRQAEQQLAALAHQDPLADPAYLREWAKEVFLLVQRCWTARNYGPVQAVMSWGLYGQQLSRLKSLRDHHEQSRIEDLSIERLELVEAVTTGTPLSFTALITFQARVYFVDDLTQAFRRGDRAIGLHQESWTFQRQGDVWMVHEVPGRTRRL